MGNITLIPRPKAEVLMKVYHISELENRILQRPSVYCVTNVKHKDTFPEVGKGCISHVESDI